MQLLGPVLLKEGYEVNVAVGWWVEGFGVDS